jgi:hypothetical protein
MRAYLDKCGQKFLSLTSVHYYQYQGMAFYMKKKYLPGKKSEVSCS